MYHKGPALTIFLLILFLYFNTIFILKIMRHVYYTVPYKRIGSFVILFHSFYKSIKQSKYLFRSLSHFRMTYMHMQKKMDFLSDGRACSAFGEQRTFRVLFIIFM